jgi:hypothetical protein
MIRRRWHPCCPLPGDYGAGASRCTSKTAPGGGHARSSRRLEAWSPGPTGRPVSPGVHPLQHFDARGLRRHRPHQGGDARSAISRFFDTLSTAAACGSHGAGPLSRPPPTKKRGRSKPRDGGGLLCREQLADRRSPLGISGRSALYCPMPSVLDLIGDTPLVEVTQLDAAPCRLFLKLESANPSGSIKDRPARASGS